MDKNKGTLISRRIVLGGDSSECARMYQFLAHNLEGLPLTLEFKHDIKLVAEELLANIIKHGYAKDADEQIELELNIDSKSVNLTFTDAGSAFNPMKQDMPEILNDLSEGGMGIMLVKSLTDEQHYTRKNNLNVFTVTKNYNKNKTR